MFVPGVKRSIDFHARRKVSWTASSASPRLPITRRAVPKRLRRCGRAIASKSSTLIVMSTRLSAIFNQQRIETLHVIFRQFVGEIADYAFSVQKDNRRRARYFIAARDAGVGVTRDCVLNAEFLDATFSAGDAVFDVDPQHTHAFTFVLRRQRVDARSFFLADRTPRRPKDDDRWLAAQVSSRHRRAIHL